MRKTAAKIRVFSTLMRIAFVGYPGRLFILTLKTVSSGPGIFTHQEPEFRFPAITGAP